MKNIGKLVAVCLAVALIAPGARADGTIDPSWSAARTWDEACLFGIRRDQARPVVHARNLYSLAVVMWDAWVTYSTGNEEPVLHHEKQTAVDVAAARREAISYAAYRLLVERFANSPGKLVSLPFFDTNMTTLGYDINVTTTVGDTPAAVGNRIAAEAIAHFLADGSNEANNYAANNGYAPVNDPLVVALGGPNPMNDPNRWQPLALSYYIDQNGIHLNSYPAFIGPHWGGVKNFSLKPWDQSGPALWLDPGPPPQIGGTPESDAKYKSDMVEVIARSAELDPDDGVTDVNVTGEK